MNSYETTEGTAPDPENPRVAHEPRTMIHRRNDDVVGMMTEIGDGVFVAWSECHKCKHRVAGCTCPGGPVEPDYMQKWRDDRFPRTLGERVRLEPVQLRCPRHPFVTESPTELQAHLMDDALAEARARLEREAKTKWFINEDGVVYDYDLDKQEADFPNDFHTPYDTAQEAEAAADELLDTSTPTQEGSFDAGF